MDPIDNEATKRTVDAIVHDIMKLPGQAGLDEKQKFGLSMEILTIVASQVIFVLSEGRNGDIAMMDTLHRRVGKHLQRLRDSYDRQRPVTKLLETLKESLTSDPTKTELFCPHCRAKAHASLGDDDRPGLDVTVCIACGGLGVVDRGAKGGVRKATASEITRIEDDPMIQLARRLWDRGKQQ